MNEPLILMNLLPPRIGSPHTRLSELVEEASAILCALHMLSVSDDNLKRTLAEGSVQEILHAAEFRCMVLCKLDYVSTLVTWH